jgi:DNA-binding response OmpR family regulator
MQITIVYDQVKAVIGGRVVGGLTYTELRLLDTLNKAKGPVSRADLFHRVWGVIRYRPGDRRVDVMVARLRLKLRSFGIMIHAVPGEGYRL